MVFPCWRMNSRSCHCAPVSSPFFERPIPADINQASYNYYFEQQSHRKGEIRKRPSAKAILNFFCGKLAAPSGIDDPGYNDRLWARPPCKAKASQGLWPSMPLDQDHVGLRCAVADFGAFALLFAVEPFPGALRRFAFEHPDALR